MTVGEVKDLKKQYEYKIMLLLTEFEDKTSVKIDSVDFQNTIESGFGGGAPILVNKKVKIKVIL